MRPFIFFCLLLIRCATWSQSDEEHFVIRTYGYPSWDDYEQLEDSIAGSWGITYLPVAGCVVTDELVDSIESLNKLTFQRLENHYGTNWKERFYAQVDSLYSKIQYQKEHTFRQVSECLKENYTLWSAQNISGTVLKLVVIQKNPEHDTTSQIRIKGLQRINPLIVYRGYENKLELDFTDPSDTCTFLIKNKGGIFLSDSCMNDPKIQLTYWASTSNRDDTLTIETTGGKMQQFVLKVQNLGFPDLCMNGFPLDSTLAVSLLKSPSELSLRAEKGCLIDFKYIISTWEISTSEGKRYIGKGSSVPGSVIEELKKMKTGMFLNLEAVISNEAENIKRKKIVSVKIER